MEKQISSLRALLFDKDGTLVDLRATWVPRYHAAARALARSAALSESFAFELLRRLGRDPATGRLDGTSPLLWATSRAIAEHWAAQPEFRASERGREELVALALSRLEDDERFPPRPLGDVQTLFARLEARGFRLGLASMDREASVRRAVERLGIAGRLAFVAGCDSGFGTKPAPGMVFGFCAALGLSPREVAVIGDSPADLAMGRAAGCGLVLAVRSGGAAVEDLAPLADRVLETVHELEALFERSSARAGASCSRRRGKSSAKLHGR
ncbi:MAG: HAD family hydrolase [Geminicoccaceae bacterium]|nr:HAD family hydrolase [Geminicoccaceae bacterium]MDW8340608.1 HAD family hydrolase [Geminicoccaceae bacterium]